MYNQLLISLQIEEKWYTFRLFFGILSCYYLQQMMELGHPVQLGVMGTFKPTLQTKCAKSMDELSVDNVVRRRIQFIPGEIFRNLLADMEIETESDEEDAPSSDGGSDSGSEGSGGGGQEFT